MVLNLMIGLLTPPVGMITFTPAITMWLPSLLYRSGHFSNRLTTKAETPGMDAIAAAIALSQYVALVTAIGGLARLSMLLTLRAFDLWQDSAVEPGQEVG